MNATVMVKRRRTLREGISLLQDNALVHKQRLANCGFKLLAHAPYSQNQPISYFFLFSKLKSEQDDRHFRSDDDIILCC
jgi:hypothetical protein